MYFRVFLVVRPPVTLFLPPSIVPKWHGLRGLAGRPCARRHVRELDRLAAEGAVGQVARPANARFREDNVDLNKQGARVPDQHILKCTNKYVDEYT